MLFKENWKFVFDLLTSNEEILNEYFNKVELEIYTSEESSVKPMSFLRNLYQELHKEVSSITSSEEA